MSAGGYALEALLVLLAGSLGFMVAAILAAHSLGKAESEARRLRRLLELEAYTAAAPDVIDLRGPRLAVAPEPAP